MKKMTAISIAFLANTSLAASTAASNHKIPDALSKFEISNVVEAAEKQPVRNVVIAGRGLAVVNYGAKSVAYVVYEHNCKNIEDEAEITSNPTCFRVLSYVTRPSKLQ